jgi:tetrachlorobenzoquinone reductase
MLPIIRVRVTAAILEAPKVTSYELKPVNDVSLPAFTPGAHIDIRLPNGSVRSYSITNSPLERHRYTISVQREESGRGGSLWISENFLPGRLVDVVGPTNNFALDECAPLSVFIAGGIGITPILCMSERLSALGRKWHMYYCARHRQEAPFIDRLSRSNNVTFNFDHDGDGQKLDIAEIVARAPETAHFYCCGPSTMLTEFKAATAAVPDAQVHLEYFRAETAPAVSGSYIVVLAKSGREIEVPAGKTIVQALEAAGIQPQYSCLEGVCGTCETKVLEGIPEHRDTVLSDQERSSNTTMMICCSGCKGQRLVLDI